MRKKEMLDLKVGSKIASKKYNYIITGFDIEIYSDGQWLESFKAQSYAEAIEIKNTGAKKVILFKITELDKNGIEQTGTESRCHFRTVRESTIKGYSII